MEIHVCIGGFAVDYFLVCSPLLRVSIAKDISSSIPLFPWIYCTMTLSISCFSRDSHFLPTLASILSTATLCTMVYGISELLDYDMPNTERLLSQIAQSLPPKTSLLIVDPVSHQFCCEKETLIRRHIENSSAMQWTILYKQHDKISVTRKLIEPQLKQYCDMLHLQIHRDVKLSCHTWTLLMQKQDRAANAANQESNDYSQETSKRVCLSPSPSPSTYSTILLLTQSPCISQWVDSLREQVRTNLWYPRDTATSLDQAIFGRLVQSWKRFGGILLIAYSQ